jgi:hypothetical protein
VAHTIHGRTLQPGAGAEEPGGAAAEARQARQRALASYYSGSHAKGSSSLSGAAAPAPGGGAGASLRRGQRAVGVLFHRAALDMARTPSLLLMHLAVGLAMGCLVGLVFYQLQYNTAGAQNRAGECSFKGHSAQTACSCLDANAAPAGRRGPPPGS